jgi:hypothetical protein
MRGPPDRRRSTARARWPESYYVRGGDEEHAFLRSKNGTFTTIDVSGENLTHAVGINRAGVVAGDSFDGTRFHGFIRMP